MGGKSLGCIIGSYSVYHNYSALEDIPYKNDQTEAGDHDIRPDLFLPGK